MIEKEFTEEELKFLEMVYAKLIHDRNEHWEKTGVYQ